MDKRDDTSETSDYDMLDDLSEISDGHDTASIASNGGDTPDDSQSEADPEDSTILTQDDPSQVTPMSAFQSFVDLDDETAPSPSRTFTSGQIKAENDLLDSYMPDDLETPRQSTIASSSPSWKSNHILYVSEPSSSPKSVMEDICSIVACAMDNGALSKLGPYKVVRMPATPSGISLPSAHVVRGQGSISATIQHCIGANTRTIDSYQLRILDQDEEHSSFFTVGQDAKIDLPKPDIAVFFADLVDDAPPAWFEKAKRAVKSLNVPTLVVFDSTDSFRSSRRTANILRQYNKSLLPIRTDDLYAIHNNDQLTPHILALMRHNAPTPYSIAAKPSTAISKNTGLQSMFNSAVEALRSLPAMEMAKPLLLMLFAVVLHSLVLRFTQAVDPAVELAARRESLSSALVAATNSSTTAKTFNIEHLLPESPVLCATGTECNFQYEGIPPTHLVVSLPGRSNFPQLVSTRVYRPNGHELPFQKTCLIDGIYHIEVDIDDAYGEVYVNMLTKKPELNFTGKHDFGNRMLHEAGKEVSKELAFVRQKARTLSEKLPSTIGAGMWATKNVTSSIALHMTRELQVIGNTAVSMLNKAAQVGNQTASALTKDLVLMQTDIIKFSNEVSTMVKSRVDSAKNFSKALIRKPIETSRERFQGLKKASGFGGRRCRYERSETGKTISVADQVEEMNKKQESFSMYPSLIAGQETAVQQVLADAHQVLKDAKQKIKDVELEREKGKTTVLADAHRVLKKAKREIKEAEMKQQKEAKQAAKKEKKQEKKGHRPRGGLAG